MTDTTSHEIMSALTQNFEQMREQIESHIAADEVVKGMYYQNGKGCFIGCLSHSYDPLDAVEKFGLTVHLLRIAEDIFEALPADEGIVFFGSFPDAISCNNKDLSLVHWQFLRDELKLLPNQTPYIQSVIEGMTLLSNNKDWSADARSAAAAAAAARSASAAAAARSASAAARSASAYAYAYARSAADARSAAAAAAAAAYAADAYAYAYARSAADDDADADARKNQAKRLLKLISEAPVKG